MEIVLSDDSEAEELGASVAAESLFDDSEELPPHAVREVITAVARTSDKVVFSHICPPL